MCSSHPSNRQLNMDRFQDLQEKELKLLCFLAYHGEDVSYYVPTEYRKLIKVDKKTYDSTIDKLNRLRYIQGKTFVRKEWHIKVLLELYTNHYKWIESFRNIGTFSRSNVAEYLCSIVKKVLDGNYKDAARLTRPQIGIGNRINLLNYIQPVVQEDIRFIRILNQPEMKEMMEEILEELFTDNEINNDVLDSLAQAITDDYADKDGLMDMLSAYRFFMYATPFVPHGKPSLWSEAVNGIRLLYEGDTENSIMSFRRALDTGKLKDNAFQNPLLSYFYGLALLKSHMANKKDQMKRHRLLMFMKDNGIRYKDKHFCIRLILETNENERDEYHRAEYIQNRHTEKLYNSFVYILYGLYEAASNKFTADMLHSAAIIQHEMSAHLPIGPLAKQQYSEAFGGAPIIGTIRTRPSWETALLDIESTISRSVVTEKRIAYYIKDFDLNAVVEQVKKDGEWVDGKVLSLYDIVNKSHESMDNYDAIIASRLPQIPQYSDAARIIIPVLADTDRLFYGEQSDGRHIPLAVRREPPYLSFEGKGGIITISSNAATDSRGEIIKETLRQTGTHEYSIVTVNALQKDVMQRFIKLKQIPATALCSLKKAIDSLNGIVNVKEDNLNQLMRPAILSNGMLAIRVMPKQYEYDIEIMAAAFENGDGRYVPGDGEETVYDNIDGLTHCINRDLTREYANYLEVKECLETVVMAKFNSYTQAHITNADGLLTLLEFVHDNSDKFFMEWPEGRPIKFKGNVTNSDIDISVISDVEWFTIDGEVKTPNLKMSLWDLIRSCCDPTAQGYIRIGDDEYIKMSEELRKQIASLDALPLRSASKKQVPKYQIGALASLIAGLNANTDGDYREFEKRTKQAYSLSPSIPDGLNATLREYQVEGFRWMCRLSAWGAGACLADDMGLGKTLQAITFMLYKAPEGPSLVVVPKSVLPNWVNEIRRFAPTLNVINLNDEAKRSKAVMGAKGGDIVLCTYGVLGTQSSLLSGKEWNVVCLDEAHQIKNRNTMASHAAMSLKASGKLALSGTPLQNNLTELWNLFQFLNPGLLGQWSSFKDSYVTALNSQKKDMLKEITRPFILRRTKKDVLTDLPDKIMHVHMVEMTDQETAVYEEMRKQAEIKFKKNKNPQERKLAATLDLNFFTELMKLRLAACSMKLVYDNWKYQSSKVLALLEILDNLLDSPDNNIIVFSQFTSFMETIKPELKRRGIEFLYLDGQTPMAKRQEYVDDFQQGRCRLFLSSLKAGGLGINLTAANFVLILDPWWNPAIENQAMDRAHRLGQKRVVSVIRLISAQTIEEKILNLHKDKTLLAKDILDGTSESGKLTYEDVMDFVSPF